MKTKLDELYRKYIVLYDVLSSIIAESEKRITQEQQDLLLADNVNFFVKSYMITMCSYLEAYLQDAAFEYTDFLNEKIKNANVPHNYLCWKLSKEPKEKEFSFKNASYPTQKKEIADMLSANPDKTIKTYKLLGIDLKNDQEFIDNKDIIGSIVGKRNNIIHHNDNATDVSLSDLRTHIEAFKKQMIIIKDAIESAL